MEWCPYPFSTNNRWEDLTAVLEADVESPIGGHPRDEGDDDADLGQRDEAAAQTAKPRADEEDEEGPAPARLGDDEGNRPAGDFDNGAKEVAHVDVHLVHLHHVRRVLDQAVVGEGASHT